MPRLIAPFVCRNDRTFNSSSRVPYWPYQRASSMPGRMDRKTENSCPGYGRGQARQRVAELDRDRLGEGAGGRHSVESGQVPDLVADWQASQRGRRQRGDGRFAVRQQEQAEPGRFLELPLDANAHVIDVIGLVDLLP